jgi:hypothetical protein
MPPDEDSKRGVEPHDVVRCGEESGCPPEETSFSHEPPTRQYLGHQLVTVRDRPQGPPFIHEDDGIQVVMRYAELCGEALSQLVFPELGNPMMWTFITAAGNAIAVWSESSYRSDVVVVTVPVPWLERSAALSNAILGRSCPSDLQPAEGTSHPDAITQC